MAYQAQRFEILSPEQANPFGHGLMQGLQGASNIQQMMQNKKMFPLTMQQMQLANALTEAEVPYAGQKAAADAAYKLAMAQYLNNPYQMQRFMTPLGKAINESQMQGIIPPGGVLPGQQNRIMPEVEGQSENPYQAYIQKTAYDPVLARQANSAQIIYNQVNDIDTKPLEKFAGLGGKTKLWKEQAKGIASSFGMDVKPSKEFREYQSYMDINKNAIMDAIRKALTTSVVPGYVASTLAPMVDPGSPIWNDPEQVRNNIETLKKWIKPYAGEQTASMAKGVPPTLEESEKRHKKLIGNENIVEGTIESTKEIDGKHYVKINGRWYEQ
jgi:hypothetical protein